jgi:thioredoxin-dependent peroxiredoxin
MRAIQPGEPAPDFTAQTHTGQSISLADFRGKSAVVLFFYPMDGTSVCTKEACGFRDAYEEFVRAGAVVIGVSGDSLSRHRDFAANQRLPFLLVSDQDGQLRSSFRVPRTLGFLPGRVTYVIDRQGVVRYVFNSQFAAARHSAEALEVVRNLVRGDEGQEGTPHLR